MSTQSAHCRQTAAGFSLIEVLAAIGILGVGLAMAMALFPVAVQFADTSAKSSLGSIICENGLNTVTLRLTHASYDPNNFSQVSDKDRLYAAELIDPNDPNSLRISRFGFAYCITNRDPNATPRPNDYQIAVMAYRVKDKSGKAQAKIVSVDGTIPLNGSADFSVFNADTSDPNNPAKVKAGTYIVPDATLLPATERISGECYAKVRLVEGNKAILDRKLTFKDGSGNEIPYTGKCFVMIQWDPATDKPAVTDDSPAIAIMVTRTALKQE